MSRHHGDEGASLIFALVAVSVIGVVVAALASATTGGFLAARAVDATGSDPARNPRATTAAALSTAIEAVRANGFTGAGSLWAPGSSTSACFGTASGVAGSPSLRYTAPQGDAVQVYCTPLLRPESASADNPFVLPTTPLSLTDGLVLLHSGSASDPALRVDGSGTVWVQGAVRANGAVSFTTRPASCPTASSATTFTATVACPQLLVTAVTAGDGSAALTAITCTPAAIVAADGVTCTPSQGVATPAAPATVPTTLGAVVARNLGDVTCTGTTATMPPGLYSHAINSRIRDLLTALVAPTPARCANPASTTLTQAAASGATSIRVASRTGFRPGERVDLYVAGTKSDTVTVNATYTPTTGAGTVSTTATSRAWPSGSTVSAASACISTPAQTCPTTGVPITTVVLTPGRFFFDLQADWTVNNAAVTVVGGTQQASSATSGADRCLAPADQSSGSGGVVLAFAGSTTSGLVVSAGMVSLCADYPPGSTGRPVAIVGPTTSLSGTYTRTGATGTTAVTLAARTTNSCTTATAATCGIVAAQGAGHLYLYGSVYAPRDDLALAVGMSDTDHLLLYGAVADGLLVTTTAFTGASGTAVRPAIGLPRRASSTLTARFVALRCASTCPTSPPGTGQVGDATVVYDPVGAITSPTRTSSISSWSVTG